jgi:hypothetical protein
MAQDVTEAPKARLLYILVEEYLRTDLVVDKTLVGGEGSFAPAPPGFNALMPSR